MHEVGAYAYCDGANLNAILGIARPGDMGFDALHINLHKTFSTPHGGGGPGAGPVCVTEELSAFLPGPIVDSRRGQFRARHAGAQHGQGALASTATSACWCVRTPTYALWGRRDCWRSSEQAVLSANYLKERLKHAYELPYDRHCMHEFVLSGARQRREHGVRTLDIAKRLLDYGYHPPTVYFPLLVEEAIMIEPTETEPLDALDAFVDAMLAIAQEVETEPGTGQEVLRTRRRSADSTRPGLLATRICDGSRQRCDMTAAWRLLVHGPVDGALNMAHRPGDAVVP